MAVPLYIMALFLPNSGSQKKNGKYKNVYLGETTSRTIVNSALKCVGSVLHVKFRTPCRSVPFKGGGGDLVFPSGKYDTNPLQRDPKVQSKSGYQKIPEVIE
jgi:hypothetical protein